MLYSVIKFLTCLFAVYGAYSLVYCMVDAIRCRNAAGSARVRVVVAVKDTEEQIEGIVRNAVNAGLSSKLMSDGNIAFVDMDSGDGTYMMLQKLKTDYENIDVFKMEERDMAFHP